MDIERQPLIGQTAGLTKNVPIAVRMGFVRKVYALLSCQLLLTVAVAAPLQTASEAWISKNMWLLYLSVAMTFASMCVMACCQDACRQFPTNYLFLFVFTFFEGVLVGIVGAAYTWQSVVLAAGITVGVFLLLTIYAFMTKSDFTGFGPYLFGALASLCMFGFVVMILSFCGVHIKWMMMAYNIIGVLIFVMYIVYDTQLILGEWGGHEKQFSIDDYCFASLTLYLDLINLFLHILQLLGDRQ